MVNYRAVWGWIESKKGTLDFSFVVVKEGGAPGGGYGLTPLGKALVEQLKNRLLPASRTTS